MPISQNGYSANDRSVIATYTVPGTTLKVALRKGDVSVVLLEYLRRYHLEVEDLYHVPQDLWGYAERTIRGSSTTLSNHASGTGVDARAVRHPPGVRNTFTAPQRTTLKKLVDWFEGVVRHGDWYVGRVDGMHAEIDKGPSEVARIANKVRALSGVVAAPPSPTGVTPAPARKKDVVIDNHLVTGKGGMRLVVPTGRASSATGRSWVSAVVNGPSTGTLRGWFQTDGGGISDFSWSLGFRDGRSDRSWAECPDGTTQINLQWDFPEGGTICLEAMPK